MRICLKLLTLAALGIYMIQGCQVGCVLDNCLAKKQSLDTLCAQSQCKCDFLGNDFHGNYPELLRECLKTKFQVCYNLPQDQSYSCKLDQFQSCSLDVVPVQFNHLTQELSQKGGCSESLNADECRDLYFVYFGKDLFPAKTLLMEVNGPHKKALDKSLKNSLYLSQSINVSFNETLVYDMLNDYIEYEEQYRKSRDEVAMQVITDANNAYPDLMTKIYIDFGEIYYPVIDAYRNVINTTVASKDCNRTCFTENCLLPDFQVDPQCIEDCGCMELESHHEAVEKYIEAKQKYNRKIDEGVQEIITDFIPSIQKYQENVAKTQEKWYEFLRKQAVPVGGCDQDCVNSCTTDQRYNIFNIDLCVSQCSCYGGRIIDVKAGQVNYQKMALYAQGRENGRKYFIQHFPQ